MADKLELIAGKVDEVVNRLKSLADENSELRKANKDLTRELTKLKKDYEALRLSSADKSDTVKTKLIGILDRLDQLEAAAD